MKNFIYILLFLSISVNLFAQADSTVASSISDSTANSSSIKSSADSTESKSKRAMASFKIEKKVIKSPTTALYLSIIPGLGQYYNESYFKSGIIFAGSVSIASVIYFNQTQFNDMQDLIDTYQSENQIAEDDATITRYKKIREAYRDERDLWGFYMLGVYAISAIDAYVGASLYEFDMNDDLSLKVYPSYRSFGLNFTVAF